MSSEDKRKCFTFKWTIENISYCWQETGMAIKSPKFKIGEIQESTFHLSLFPRGSMEFYEDYIGFYLIRQGGCRSLKLDCELSFLSMDNVVLASKKYENITFSAGSREFKERKELFFCNRSAYLSQDKLRARCRIWKIDEGMTEDVECFARTRICIERVSFLWNIKNFSSLRPEEKRSKQIKSVLEDEVLITFDLFIKNGNGDEEPINLLLVSNNDKVKYFVLHLTALNEMIRNQSVFHDANEAKLLTLPFSKKNLLANKNLCLPNDVLSFRGECIFSTGKVLKEIERVVYGCESLPTSDAGSHFLDEENSLSISKRTLNENLKSLFHDNILPDIKLKTSSEIYFAHKSILSARSPVFRAMFSNNMKEKFSDCVDIEDLSSDTVYRMLHYVYTAEVKDIQFEDACELYRAADKYEILPLRDQCSAYLKCNFCPSNVCEALILADTHQDKDLKTAAQDFIFEHDVINNEEWLQLLGTNLKLAADTMYSQIQKVKNKRNPPTRGFGSNIEDTKFASCPHALPPSSIGDNIGGSSFLSPESDGNIGGSSFLSSESYGNIGGPSFLPPESDGNIGVSSFLSPESYGNIGEPSFLSPESDGNNGGPSFLSPESDGNIGGSSFLSPESDGNIAGTSASSGFAYSVAAQRGRRMMRRAVRRLARFNSHIPSAVFQLDFLPSSYEGNATGSSFLSLDSDGNVAGTSASSGFATPSGETEPTGRGRLIMELRRFQNRREEQSRR
ncbi:TD and POZ domain-containing protein 4 [Araneus ventricosus]|uniref:TD and POZ domain-containing protein 4 n=1 Tax=Araneus ventricosus TaxID=182803 RepID=A0A4Y2A9K1_ARAVE|nr:TD and POZ domain-containing protein 4 [Araneus ventricosus]